MGIPELTSSRVPCGVFSLGVKTHRGAPESTAGPRLPQNVPFRATRNSEATFVSRQLATS